MRQNATATTWLQRGLLAVLGTTLVVAGLQATGNSVATVNVADGTVWLAAQGVGGLVQVSASSDQVLAKVKVPDNRGDLSITQEGHSALVLNRTTGAVGRVDGAALDYVDEQTFPGSSADFQLVSGGGRAYLIDTNAGRVRALDASDLEQGEQTETDRGPRDSKVDSDGNLWSLDAAHQKVTLVRANGDSTTATAGGEGSRLTLVDDHPYVIEPATSDEGGRVVALDGHSAKPGRQFCLDGADKSTTWLVTGTEPRDKRQLAVAVGADNGQVLTSDLQSGKCTVLSITDDNLASTGRASASGTASDAGSAPATRYGEPVVSGDLLFVPVLSDGEVIVVDTAENRIVRTIESKELFVPRPGATSPFDGQRFELVLDDGNVWFNDLDGPEAFLLGRDGVVLSVLKYEAKPGAKGTGDVSQGLAATDDPNALPVDLGPGDGSDSTGKGDAADNGTGQPKGSGSDASPGGSEPDKAKTGTDGTGLALSPAQPESPPGSNLQLLPPGSASDPARNSTAKLPDVTVSPGDNRSATGPASSGLSPLPGQSTPSPAPADTPNAPKPPSNGKLTATFQWSTKGDIPLVNQAIAFTDGSSGTPPPTSWLWDFGDGTTDKSQNPSHTYTKPGTYPVTLTVGNGQATDKSAPAQIEVRDPQGAVPPVAKFSFSPTNPEVGQPVTFKDASLGAPTDYTWSWGDGTATQTGPSPSHTFTQAGSFKVTLTVTNRYGSNSLTQQVDVVDKVTTPKANFTFSPTTDIAVSDVVTFTDTSTGGPTKWRWDFGDGSDPSAAKSVTHKFAAPGTYTVRLEVSNAKGSADISREVTVNPSIKKPKASMTIRPSNTVEVGQNVTFVSTSTGEPSVTWNFGDGGTSNDATAVHAYAIDGSFTVILKASNQAGDDQVTATITVTKPSPAKPVANFSVRPGANSQDAAPAGTPVQFQDLSGPTITAREWDFGDGTKATGAAVTHVYGKGGQYTAKLKVTAGDQSAETSRTVYVIGAETPAPTADFTFSPPKPNVAEAVAFTDASKNATAWSWDFGDGTAVATTQNASHAFGAAGTYNVTLTATNAAGQKATKTLPVTVTAVAQPPPSPVFVVDPASPVAGKPVTFTDQTPGAPVTTPQFSFSNGEGVTAPPGTRVATYTFNAAGPVDVTMKVCWAADPTNCKVSAVVHLDVKQAVLPPVASFKVSGPGVAADADTVIAGQPVVFTDASTNADATGTTYAWMFGTTTVKDQKEVAQTFTTAGDVNVTLTVTNSAGSSTAARVLHVVVQQPPVAAFAVDPKQTPAGRAVQFTDRSTGEPTQWAWDFGDGKSSTEQSPTHTYETANPTGEPYTVKLTVTNRWGSNTTTGPVTVTAPAAAAPQPQIRVDSPAVASQAVTAIIGTVVQRGTEVQLSDASGSANVTSWSWDFGDKSTGSGQRVTHTWERAGSYTVTLVVTNASNQRGEATATIRVV
jgi:PKD repeat protein